MKRILMAIVFLAAFPACAAPVSLALDEIPLIDLVRLVYNQIGNKQTIFSTEALEARALVSLHLKDVEEASLIGNVNALLASHGLSATTLDGVVWIVKAKPLPESETVYRPVHRSVSYLLDVLNPLFPPGAFGTQRQLPNQSTALQAQAAHIDPSQGSARPGSSQQKQARDTGTSVYSMIDKQSDVLIFKGTEKDAARLAALLLQLDTATPELMVKAVVYEVTVDNGEKSALSIAANLLGGRIGIKTGKSTAGDFSAVFSGLGFDVVFDALQSDRRFKVVSSPSLRVQSGATARLTVGSETPVLGNAQMDKNGNPVQSVDYRPAGVILDLKPQIRESVSDIQISQQISNFIPTTTGVNASPTLLKREVSTQVGIRGDDVLILGGLDESRGTNEARGLPFLPDWLTDKSSQNSKTEILMILQATRI